MDTITETGQKTIPSISIDSTTIYKRLTTTQIGDVITYQELGGLIGADIQKEAYHNLVTAKKKALRENGMVFASVRGVGIKRTNASETIDIGEARVKSVRRQLKKAANTIATVDPANLEPDERNRHSIVGATLGALTLCTKPSSQGKIEQAVRSSGGARPDAVTLMNLFSK